MNDKKQHLLSLKVDHFKKIEAFHVDLSSKNMMLITGKNRQGKSSVIDAIHSALAGKSYWKNEIENPIKDGEEEASVSIETDRYLIHRYWKRNGKDYIKILDAEGIPQGSQETLLARFYNEYSRDPHRMSNMNNKDQTEFLFKLLGLTDDLQSYDESRQVAYNERRDVNRDLSKAHAKLESHEIYEEVPDVPDYNEIVKNLNQARYHNQTLIDAKSSLDEHVKNIEVLNKNINDRKVRIKSDIEELKDKIKRLKAELDEGWKDIDDAIEHNKHEVDECREYIDTFEEADVSKWENKLGEINELTKKATDAKEYFELKDEAEKLTKESQSFTSEIEAIDQDKEEFVKSIDMPVDGMTIERETNNILYEGTAVKDLSMSESIIFWSKVYLSTNPELRMMTLDNGESLDSEAKQKLNDFAKENNLLYIVTVVDESGNNGIVIEDGQIKENNYEK